MHASYSEGVSQILVSDWLSRYYYDVVVIDNFMQSIHIFWHKWNKHKHGKLYSRVILATLYYYKNSMHFS